MSIKEHLIEVQTNVGTVIYIVTTRKNIPKNLSRPYEYEITATNGKQLYNELNTILKPYFYQCVVALAHKKSLSYGIKLNTCIIAYDPGPLSPRATGGLNRTQWNELKQKIQNTFFKYLGKDARIYADRHSRTKKFQLRFCTYIAYTELLDH